MSSTVAGLLQVAILLVLLAAVYKPLGDYLARVFTDKKHLAVGVWVVSRIPGLQNNAEGSVVTADGRAVGSDLIGIDPVAGDDNTDPANDPWFHNRPSAVALDSDGDGSPDLLGPADPSISAGANKGASDEDLVAAVKERREIIAEREGVGPPQVPADAVTASASGLDPAISPAYAELQAPRVAQVNGLTEDQVRALITEHTEGRGLGVLGEPAVNVLTLNLAIQAANR